MKSLKKYQMYDALELFFIIVGAIGSICSIYSVFYQQSKYSVILMIIIISCGVVVCFIKINKLNKVADTNLKTISECIHNTAHTIRNEHAAICKRYKNNTDKLTIQELVANMNYVGKNVVDNLSQILNEVTGEKINVCIKYFCINKPIIFGDLTHEQKQDLMVTELCRCKYSKGRRENIKDKIVDSTDLKWITFEQYKHFYEPDLDEFSEKLKESKHESYTDSNPTWRDFFRAKITVPIQLDLSYIKPEGIKNKSYDLLGFIVADSLSNSAFRDENILYFVEICKAFADMLYRYLERYIYLWGQLQTNSNANEQKDRSCS